MRDIEYLLKKVTDPNLHFDDRQLTYLYHYTGTDALQNIISSRSFWLTDIRYLNDESEYNHVFDFAMNYAYKQEDHWLGVMGLAQEDVGEFLYFPMHENKRRVDDVLRGKVEEENLTEEEAHYKKVVLSCKRTIAKAEKRGFFYHCVARAIEDYRERDVRDAPACFITSFSQNRDQLSQWRGYCPNGGYSLGLNAIELWKSVSPDFVLAKCLYGNVEKGKRLESIFASFLPEFNALVAKGLNASDGSRRPHLDFENVQNLPEEEWNGEIGKLRERFWNWKKRIGEALARFAPFFKHEGFKEEEEWRFVNASAVFPDGFKEPDRQFRPGASSLIPYTVMCFKEFDFSVYNAIEVTVGPMNNQEIAADALLNFLCKELGEEAGYNTVKRSIIPYRTQ